MARSNKKGIIASELCVVLISDFVKERQKKDRISSNKNKVDFAEFFPKSSQNMTPTRKTVELKFDDNDDRFVTNELSLSPAKKRKMATKKKAKPRRRVHKELLV
jgi:hypothetical protein